MPLASACASVCVNARNYATRWMYVCAAQGPLHASLCVLGGLPSGCMYVLRKDHCTRACACVDGRLLCVSLCGVAQTSAMKRALAEELWCRRRTMPDDAQAPPSASASAAPKPKTTRAKPPRRRFISVIPPSISEDPELRNALSALPANYNFEVPKTIWRLKQMNAKTVALQMPEGLLLYACTIADILERFAGAEAVIMGDVTYGACCVDDLSAAALGCELLVHYGHSCLVPIDRMATDVLYVFVEIDIDTPHLVDTIRHNFTDSELRIAVCGTVQFQGAMHAARAALSEHYAEVALPQCKPLSAGEVLGCTAPLLAGHYDLCVFVADGRFHPEAVMIANPTVPLYRYDPYSKAITRERYEHAKMHGLRRTAIDAARGATRWGLVLGTLGRQGNPDVLSHLQALLEAKGCSTITVLLSEVFPAKLACLSEVEAWVQVCCPRLSLDWGHAFGAPLLTPYELEVCLGCRGYAKTYPMDNYAKDGGSYANYWGKELHEKREGVRRSSGCCSQTAGGERACCAEGGEPTQRAASGGCDEGRQDCCQKLPPTATPTPAQAKGATNAAAGTAAATANAAAAASSSAPTADKPSAAAAAVAVELEPVTSSAPAADPPKVGPPTTVAVRTTDVRWINMCAAIEKKCFAKHEAMDVAKEAKARGVTLLCAAMDDEDPNACVGFAVVQRSSLALNLTKLVVMPAKRRMGVGRALLDAVVGLARQGRAQVCTLHVDESNEAAKRLYEATGFVVQGRREDYYRVGRSALFMEMKLID